MVGGTLVQASLFLILTIRIISFILFLTNRNCLLSCRMNYLRLMGDFRVRH
jgi:hypothetical protein